MAPRLSPEKAADEEYFEQNRERYAMYMHCLKMAVDWSDLPQVFEKMHAALELDNDTVTPRQWAVDNLDSGPIGILQDRLNELINRRNVAKSDYWRYRAEREIFTTQLALDKLREILHPPRRGPAGEAEPPPARERK